MPSDNVMLTAALPDPAAYLTTLRAKPWRAVESQRHMATRKLVDHLDEHQILERLLEQSLSKAALAVETALPASVPLHELLHNPFRYPPLRHGSRFGTRQERGIWYGALRISTVLAEVAYYRLRFLAASHADLGPISTDFTLFQTQISTFAGLDLSRPPYASYRNALAHPSDYRVPQLLSQRMRYSGVDAFKFCSARDPRKGANIGLFSPAAFSVNRPLDSATWHSVSTPQGVEFRHNLQRINRWYPRESFLVGGQLPVPS